MRTAILALQGAIYNQLINNAALMAKVTGVFDDVPDGQTKPYVVLGDDTVNPFLTFGRDGEDFTHTLHIYSDYPGKKEVKEIMNLVLQAMTDTPLTMSGFSVVGTECEFMTDSVEQDGILRHGVMRFRIKVQEG